MVYFRLGDVNAGASRPGDAPTVCTVVSHWSWQVEYRRSSPHKNSLSSLELVYGPTQAGYLWQEPESRRHVNDGTQAPSHSSSSLQPSGMSGGPYHPVPEGLRWHWKVSGLHFHPAEDILAGPRKATAATGSTAARQVTASHTTA